MISYTTGAVITRESVYAALFALASSSSSFVTTSRRWQAWANFPSESHPALFQVQRMERAIVDIRGVPTKWELLVDLFVYTSVGQDPLATPSTALNAILDALEASFPTGPGNVGPNRVQTLGGLVSEARIYGEIETDEGTLGSQAVAMVPIRIVTR